MRVAENGFRRAAAVLALVIVAAIALRGYVPGADPIPKQRSTSSPATIIAIVSIMSIAIVVTFIGLLQLLRRRKSAAVLIVRDSGADGPRGLRKRLLYLAAAAVLVFAIATALSTMSLGRSHEDTAPPTQANEQQSDAETQDKAPPPEEAPAPEENPLLIPLLAAQALLLVGLMIVGGIIVVRRSAVSDNEQFRIAPFDESSESVSDTLARAAALGLAEIADPDREPRAAIIACYAAMERALAEAPDAAPHESDTPTEVLARAVDHGVLHSDAAATLVALFTEARFSPHRMTEEQRTIAIDMLQLVSADLRGAS